jgi:hypothetical protein
MLSTPHPSQRLCSQEHKAQVMTVFKVKMKVKLVHSRNEDGRQSSRSVFYSS